MLELPLVWRRTKKHGRNIFTTWLHSYHQVYFAAVFSRSTSQHREHFDEKCPDLTDCQIFNASVLIVVTSSATVVGSIL